MVTFCRGISVGSPVARKFCWCVLLREMWTFPSAAIQPTTVQEQLVDELIFYGVYIAGLSLMHWHNFGNYRLLFLQAFELKC